MMHNTDHSCDPSEHDVPEEMMYSDDEEAMDTAEEMGMDAYHSHQGEEEMMHVPGMNCAELMDHMDESESSDHGEDEEEEMALDDALETVSVYQA